METSRNLELFINGQVVEASNVVDLRKWAKRPKTQRYRIERTNKISFALQNVNVPPSCVPNGRTRKLSTGECATLGKRKPGEGAACKNFY